MNYDEQDLINEFHELLMESKQDDERELRKMDAEYERSSWIVSRDTRVRSQVIMNKPRNLVKKVIR